MKTRWAFDVAVRSEAAQKVVDIALYDVIGDSYGDSPTAKQVLDTLAANPDASQINVRINSRGGIVDEGVTIHNILAQHPAPVRVHVDGLAASIASVIAMAGDEIIMADNAMMMIHDPWTLAIGSASDMRKTADYLDKTGDTLAGVYAARTGKSLDEVKAAMAAETWMNADEALGNGYATKVVPAKKAAAAMASALDLSGFRHAPAAAMALAAASKAPPLAKAVPYKEYPKREDTSWDGAAAVGRMRKWASSDGSGSKDKIDWTKYRNGFAWYDEKNVEDFGSYKLPHHDVSNGGLVTSRQGTIAAGDAVSGSRGGTSIPESELGGVRSHLQKHYAQFGLKAPWESSSDNALRAATKEEPADAPPPHDPEAAVPVIELGLRMLSGHDVEVTMGPGPDVPLEKPMDSSTAKRAQNTHPNAAHPAAPRGKTNMTKEELKAQHPELYAAVLAEGEKDGVSKERKRVSAHIKLGTSSGDMKFAHDCIANGASAQDDEVFASYQSAAMNRRDGQARQSDSNAAGAALDGVAAPKANAGTEVKDAVDEGVERFLASRGKAANG
jgi:ATP-dependent protease ClpP protease subunit